MKKFWLLSLAAVSALCFILASACGGGHEHTWTTVLHADTYIVTVNGEEHRFTEETSYTFDGGNIQP